jgi:hypothetical protein
MAPSAPRPRRAEEPAGPRTNSYFRLTLRGKTLELQQAVSLQEKFAIRYATGMPFEAFWSGEARIGEDSFSVLWWLARRQNGEPGLPFEQHLAEWPTDLQEGDIEMELVEDEGEPTDDPEGSGPG